MKALALLTVISHALSATPDDFPIEIKAPDSKFNGEPFLISLTISNAANESVQIETIPTISVVDSSKTVLFYGATSDIGRARGLGPGRTLTTGFDLRNLTVGKNLGADVVITARIRVYTGNQTVVAISTNAILQTTPETNSKLGNMSETEKGLKSENERITAYWLSRDASAAQRPDKHKPANESIQRKGPADARSHTVIALIAALGVTTIFIFWILRKR